MQDENTGVNKGGAAFIANFKAGRYLNLRMENCIFGGNSNAEQGGAVYIEQMTLIIIKREF